jgi:hypothetical protein
MSIAWRATLCEALGCELRVAANFSTGSEVELTSFGECGRSIQPPEVS